AKRQEVDVQTRIIDGLEAKLYELQPAVAPARQKVEQAEKRVLAIEYARDARASAWQAASRHKDGVERFSELATERDAIRKRLRGSEDSLTKERGRLAAFRDKQSLTFSRITDRFSAIIRRLV